MSSNTVQFIAPNGAKVIVKDWSTFIRRAPKGVALHVIFNDPVFKELTK